MYSASAPNYIECVIASCSRGFTNFQRTQRRQMSLGNRPICGVNLSQAPSRRPKRVETIVILRRTEKKIGRENGEFTELHTHTLIYNKLLNCQNHTVSSRASELRMQTNELIGWRKVYVRVFEKWSQKKMISKRGWERRDKRVRLKTDDMVHLRKKTQNEIKLFILTNIRIEQTLLELDSTFATGMVWEKCVICVVFMWHMYAAPDSMLL